MIIETAKIKDIKELSDLAQKVYAETFSYSMTAKELESELWEHKSEHYFLSAMNDRQETFLITRKEGKIIGYVGLRSPDMDVIGRQPTNKDQALNGIYVDTAIQGQGIGRELMDAAFQQPRFLQAENIYLSVWEENKPAYNFYLNYGFEKVGKRNIIIDNKIIGYDLVLMYSNKKTR